VGTGQQTKRAQHKRLKEQAEGGKMFFLGSSWYLGPKGMVASSDAPLAISQNKRL
jgi:hypothetical protein